MNKGKEFNEKNDKNFKYVCRDAYIEPFSRKSFDTQTPYMFRACHIIQNKSEEEFIQRKEKTPRLKVNQLSLMSIFNSTSGCFL